MTADEALDWIEAHRARQGHHWWYIPKSPERTAAFRALYAAEVPVWQIARAVNLSDTTIKNELRGVFPELPRQPDHRARNREIFAASQTGERYGKIATRYGISAARVQQIVTKEKRLEGVRTARAEAAQEIAAEAERVRTITAEREAKARAARYAQALAAGRFVPLEHFAAVHTPETEWQAMAAEAHA